MSGSSGDKTEQPTPKKLRDARAKGQVARSQDVVTAASLIAVIGVLAATFPGMLERMIAMMDHVAATPDGDYRAVVWAAILFVSRETIIIMAPVLLVCIVAAIAANYFQVGPLFAFEGAKPSLEKISPSAGFKRIFSMKQLVETLKSILKIVFLTVLLTIVLEKAIGPYITAMPCGMPCILAITSSVLSDVLVYTALAFIVVALADFAYQKRSHTKSLMMTKEDVKREYKESEGDPHVKGMRKQLAHELVMSDAGAATRKSTALVVNPTHFAVAIRYVPDETPLPMVVAKGRNLTAYYLRAQAEEAGVPVFRNAPLARALHAEAELGGYVPDDLFDAVAEVLAWVDRHRDRLYDGRLTHGDIDMEAGDHRHAPSWTGSR
ncbi:type III secretion system export apparatus subunit SctU [Chthonobacter rhizosphaerae]|uniref:type III secretion system export apparatus subunit SctU n=1 Tax=Chthonobacter rhizosphaerae TaxID=2735553 RepID=UPI0015EECBB8